MSYIRTKDCVYELEGKKVSSYNYINKENSSMGEGVYEIYYYDENMGQHLERDSNGGRSMDCIYESEIIKVADTIEELCDEFVIDDKRNNVHYIMDYYDVMEELQEGRFHSTDEIYGAIWTDKGLIYVAKMNSEGKLVLL